MTLFTLIFGPMIDVLRSFVIFFSANESVVKGIELSSIQKNGVQMAVRYGQQLKLLSSGNLSTPKHSARYTLLELKQMSKTPPKFKSNPVRC